MPRTKEGLGYILSISFHIDSMNSSRLSLLRLNLDLNLKVKSLVGQTPWAILCLTVKNIWYQ